LRVKYGLKPGDEQWADWSATEIAVAMDAGRVVINPLIYAEVSVGYQTIEELEDRLPASDFEREPLPYLAGFAAGKAFVRYRRSGGGKRSPLPDFYIGAHAAVAGYRLLTRDVPRYRTYFPTIDIIAPAARRTRGHRGGPDRSRHARHRPS
jgi:predicted nucleic acid-binding protein